MISIRPSSLPAEVIFSLPVPSGYVRQEYSDTSYSAWIQKLPIKDSDEIDKYDGTHAISSFYNIMAVVNIPLLFRADIEQCADWGFRFWTDFHQQTGRTNRLYLFDYNGRRYYFRDSKQTLKMFLKRAMVNANSHSLKAGCQSIDTFDLRPGDMVIQNESCGVGHVSIIMDVCRNKSGKRRYLIGYGFMPAQQFHIEKADNEQGQAGWFSIKGYEQYLKEHLDYGKPVYRRF